VTSCWGTLRGFRLSADKNAYAIFGSELTGGGWSRSFGARWNGVEVGCTFLPGTPSYDIWPQLIANPDLMFAINATGGVSVVEQLTARSYDLP
jgi:hypothetical protein